MRILVKVSLLLLLFFHTACNNSSQETQTPVYREIQDLYGKKVAATIGSSQEATLSARHPQIEVLRFDTDADLLNALRANQCEAIAVDQHIFRYFKKIMDGAVELEDVMFSVGMGFCFGKDYNVELRRQFNDFLKYIKADGTYDQIVDRWLNNANTAGILNLS